MKFKKAFLVVAAGVAVAFSTHAQPANVQQLENNRQTLQQQMPLPSLRSITNNAPELYAGENEDIGPQRILRANPRTKYFDILLDSQVFYSDNANFAQEGAGIHSGVFVNTVQAAFSPPAMKLGPGKIAGTIGFSSQWYNYENSDLSPLDFNAQTAFIAGRYAFGKWQAGVGLNYTRLLNQSAYDETYNEFLPALSIQRFFPINDTMLLAIGDQVDYHFSEVPSVLGSRTDINDHFDNSVFITFNWQVCKRLALQPFYRFQYANYPYNTLMNSDRNDFINAVGVTLLYNICKYGSVRVFFNYNTKSSDDNLTAEYDEFNGGLGVALNLKF
jgi:hypothetical protein